MATVASRELRNQTRALLDRVAHGERITVTVNGQPVAELTPLTERPQWIGKGRFLNNVLVHQADAELSAELASLTGETTDDLPWR